MRATRRAAGGGGNVTRHNHAVVLAVRRDELVDVETVHKRDPAGADGGVLNNDLLNVVDRVEGLCVL